AMEERTCVEWDKDDLDSLNILKIDVLGLGMLSCLRRGFDLLNKHYASLPPSSSAIAFDGAHLLPLPACGERVGVRGHLHKRRLASPSLLRSPLTRNEREGRAHSDLSPQAGRGKGRNLCDCHASSGQSRAAEAPGIELVEAAPTLPSPANGGGI